MSIDGGHEVPDMYGVERAPEDADAFFHLDLHDRRSARKVARRRDGRLAGG